MIALYAIPYSRALGRPSLALASGELWLSLGVGSALVFNGLLARWQLLRWSDETGRG